MAFMAAGWTGPRVSQAAPARNPGACSLIAETKESSNPSTSQITPLKKMSSRGPRQEMSISAATSRFSEAPELTTGDAGRVIALTTQTGSACRALWAQEAEGQMLCPRERPNWCGQPADCDIRGWSDPWHW